LLYLLSVSVPAWSNLPSLIITIRSLLYLKSPSVIETLLSCMSFATCDRINAFSSSLWAFGPLIDIFSDCLLITVSSLPYESEFWSYASISWFFIISLILARCATFISLYLSNVKVFLWYIRPNLIMMMFSVCFLISATSACTFDFCSKKNTAVWRMRSSSSDFILGLISGCFSSNSNPFFSMSLCKSFSVSLGFVSPIWYPPLILKYLSVVKVPSSSIIPNLTMLLSSG